MTYCDFYEKPPAASKPQNYLMCSRTVNLVTWVCLCSIVKTNVYIDWLYVLFVI
jgi:hypothetical protein